MARPLALLLLALALFAPSSSVASHDGGGMGGGVGGGGGGAFGPLPPPVPAETPTPEPQDAGTTGDVSREVLFLIGGGVIVIFFAIGWAITRDARRSLTEDDRAAVEGTRVAGSAPRKQDMAKMKERQRAKTRAQRQARKKTRRANRG